jgi:alpha-D-ribose 1-methylphosphonate 5-triphosphate synthase subunit PhnH
MVERFSRQNLHRQRTFRVLLEALSRPGTVLTLSDLPSSPNEGEDFYFLLVAETLLDHEVRYSLPADETETTLGRRVKEICFQGPVSPEEADFLLAPRGSTGGALYRAKRGFPEYPDQSATVLYGVRRIGDRPKENPSFRLEGPGISAFLSFPFLDGFDWTELELLLEINRGFPLGVDAFFVDPGGKVLGLPRSTRPVGKEA